MNKKIWSVIAAIVVVVVIVWIFAGSNKSPQKQATGLVAQQTLHDLITSGVNQTCTFSVSATASSSSLSGTIYLASGNMQGDFVKTDPENKITNAHVIVAKDVGYIWSDQSSNKGYKMSWSLMSSSTALQNKSESIDMNQPTTYTCTNWTPDQSKFMIPTTVQFTDISALMKKFESTATPNNCASCASLLGTYKTKCLAALHC